MNNHREVWRDITGFYGYYQVSNLGRVRSLDRYVERRGQGGQVVKGRLLKMQRAGAKHSRPYLHVCLRRDGERIGVFVHQLVAWMFHGDPPANHHVHHINGNTIDNRAENLTYRPARDHLSTHNAGAGNPSATLLERDVQAIRQMLSEGVPGAKIARQFGVTKGSVYNIAKGRTWANIGRHPVQLGLLPDACAFIPETQDEVTL